MEQKEWTPDEKFAIVIEGLKGKISVADICREYQISQSLYCQWRDKYLEAGKRGLANDVPEGNAYRAAINKVHRKWRGFNFLSSKNSYNNLAILFILIAFSYTCIRAYVLSLTHDEAITFLNHVRGSLFDIFAYRRPLMSNNHLLNTILVKIFSNLFGTSEFVIRIPALIGHGLYLIGVYKILNLFLRGRFLLLGTCLLICHPLMLDLFSCARGFSLGLGFLILGLYYFFKGIKGSEFGQHMKDNVFAAIMFALSTLSHLAFLNVFLSVMVVFVLSELIALFKKGPSINLVSKQNTYKKVFFTVVPSSLFLLMIYTYPVVKMMRAGSEFTYGGTNGFWQDTITSLIGVTLYKPFLNANIILFAKLLIIALLFFSFLISLYDWLTKREFELTTKYLVSLILMLLICSFSVILQHFIFGIKYPIDRYAIYLIPIFFLLILVCWQDIRFIRSKLIRIPINSLFYLIITILLINSINRINFTHFYQWKYDASTKNVINSIIEINRGEKLEDNSIGLGIDWVFEPSVNFYRTKYGLTWIRKANRDGPDGIFDYYYLTYMDQEIIRKHNLSIIKKYDLSSSCLAIRVGSLVKSGAYDFMANFGDGHITPDRETSTPTGKPVSISKGFEVRKEKRDVIVTLAGSKIEFDIPKIREGSKLALGVGMNSKVGDGAEGIISIEEGGSSEIIYSKYLNPIDRSEDRKWFDETLDLSKFKGKKVKIIFEAKPGPKGDATADWFAWSNPVLKF